jgi:hypothetical protein
MISCRDEENIKALRVVETLPRKEVEAFLKEATGEIKGTPEEEATAFLCFVRDNPNGLCHTPMSTATRIIEALADEGMEPRKLLVRVINSGHSGCLFDILFEKIRGDEAKRLALLNAVVTIPYHVRYAGHLDAQSEAAQFTRAEDFEHLLNHHRAALLHPDDEHLYLRFSPNAYWRKRVRWYIVKCDYRRAWDELRKANRGFFIGSKEEAPRFGNINPNLYRYSASGEVLTASVHELFNNMVKYGVLSPLSDEDKVPYSEILESSFANALRPHQETDRGRPTVVNRSEAMVLKIARHFRKERDAQRRKRWDEASVR